MSKAVLLLNLGSPRSPSVSDVRHYLREFLSDGRVIDVPGWLRAIILNVFILPFRPKRSAAAYKRIWTDQGSPLIVMSERQQALLQAKVDIPVELAMRYGTPSIPQVIEKLKKQGIRELFIMPLYPHYAMSSYETVLVKVMEEIERQASDMQTTTLQPFYKDKDYIEALVASAKPYIDSYPDAMLLFTFHGVPQRHLRKSDPSHAHCLKTKDCCKTANPAHATCYKHQCLETARCVVDALGLNKEQYTISFQSRLGRDPWLEPYTDETIERLAKSGVKKLLVISPSFISDCLETLEEISMEGKHSFMEAGGEFFFQIPCLNDHPSLISFLQNRIQSWLHGE